MVLFPLSFFFRRAPERERGEMEKERGGGGPGRGPLRTRHRYRIQLLPKFDEKNNCFVFKQFFNLLTNYCMLSPFHKYWNSFLWSLRLKGGRRRFSLPLRVCVCCRGREKGTSRVGWRGDLERRRRQQYVL